MSFFNRILGRSAAPSSRPSSQMTSVQSQHSNPAASTATTRRELLRSTLRDTLTRHGIPASWITCETLVTTSRTREQGIHWRLVVHHWDPRLLAHGIAFQQSLIKRVTTFDPLASAWLMGISWQFALADESSCPPMPHPVVWTSDSASAAAAASPAAAQHVQAQAAPSGGSADVIAGPVRIAEAAAAPVTSRSAVTKAELDQLFAARDADFKRHATGQSDADPSQYLPTEPARL
jgi:hypothetical protein